MTPDSSRDHTEREIITGATPYPDEPDGWEPPVDDADTSGFDWLPETLPTDLVDVGNDPELERIIRSVVNRPR